LEKGERVLRAAGRRTTACVLLIFCTSNLELVPLSNRGSQLKFYSVFASSVFAAFGVRLAAFLRGAVLDFGFLDDFFFSLPFSDSRENKRQSTYMLLPPSSHKIAHIIIIIMVKQLE
jgi:hypothetical protein